jgi:dynactin complex subunit
MNGEKFDNPSTMFAVTESELQRFRKIETENTLLKVQIEGLEKENEQLKKDIIEIEKLSDSRWEENQRLRAELQIKYLGCHS